jgi:hypothetical protein
MSDLKHLRKRCFVDPKIQGALVLRIVAYWLVCVVGIVLMVVCWGVGAGPARPFYLRAIEMWPYYGPAVLVSLLMLPLVAVDIIRFTNRFVGPMLRLRQAMRQLAEGQYVEPIEFRGTDLWQEFADAFNAVLAHAQGPVTVAKLDDCEHDEEMASVA